MTVGKKIKTVDNKIKQKKSQYNLDRKTDKTSALLWGNVSRYECLTGKYILPEKDLLEKAAIMKRFDKIFIMAGKLGTRLSFYEV